MNKKAYRLIFSKSRGMLIAVAEIVMGHVKGSTPTSAPQVADLHSVFTLFSLKAIALSACLLLGSAVEVVHAQALPTGGNVVGGAASIAQANANKMVVTQTTSKAVINWNTFNVGSGNTLQFVQPSVSSQVLNRVVGVSGPSQILGTLTANGQVFIVNSQGIVFGNGAMVNVGSLLAATRDISPSAFMVGGPLTFSGGSNTNALISNDGSLTASSGFIVLAADQIRNTGSLTAQGGQIMLTAGDQATLSLSNGQLVQFTVAANADNLSIANSGIIQAQDGRISLTANATNSLLNSVINLTGVLSAQGGSVAIDSTPIGSATLNNATVDVSHQNGMAGNITISAQEIKLLANTHLLASGSSGGGTVILAGNAAGGKGQVTVVDSVINVSGVVAANSKGGAGGTAILAGNQVGLFGNSSIDASGVAGGGKVIIGGDRLGKVNNLMAVAFANQTYIDSSASIQIGSGAGDGGFVETSGQTLTMLGNVSGASKGKNGEWLIDPSDITINAQASANVVNTSNTWSGTAYNGNILNTSITNALSSGTNVTVTTASNQGAGGSLTVAADLIVTNPSNASLTLFANQSLIFNGVNVCATGTGTLGLNATAATGTMTIANTNFSLNGGAANLIGNSTNGFGVCISGNVAFNGNDQITINGTGKGNNNAGVEQQTNSNILNKANLKIIGVSDVDRGVMLNGNFTTNGSLNITATTSAAGFSGFDLYGNLTQNSGSTSIVGINSNSYQGVNLYRSNITNNNGSFNISGTGNASYGIVMVGTNITNNNGSLSIAGTTNSTGAYSGLILYGDAGAAPYSYIVQNNGNLTIASTTSGTVSGITLGGTSLQGAALNNGSLGSGTLYLNNGSLSLTGVSNTSSGVLLSAGSSIMANKIGTLNISGTSKTSYGVNLAGNLSKTNGSLNINGASNSGVGVQLSGNIGATDLNVSTTIGDIVQAAGTNLTVTNSVQLLAGTGSAAGNISGGNLTLSSGGLNMSANGTVTIFSGSPNTANLQANITGANSTGVDYKTYNATIASISTVTGTQNFYYRSAPTVNVTVNNKVYDTTQNASGSVSGAVDGDVLATSGLKFNNASAGAQTVNTSTLTIVSANSAWNISGYSATTTNNATIAKASVTLNVAGTVSDKVYDTTTNASMTGNSSGYVLLGNSSSANGNTTNSAFAVGGVGTTGAFTNASAGVGQTVNLTNTLLDTTNYTLVAGSVLSNIATISKANVSIQNVSAFDKVYDTTTNASIQTANATVVLGNSSLANGSVNSSASFSNYSLTASFTNASAGNNQTVSFNSALTDSTNYTLVSTEAKNYANISKANVSIQNVSAFDKVYDTTTNASLSNNGSAIVTLGNSTLANGSLNSSSAFSAYNITGTSFSNASAGINQTVNLTTALIDSINYTILAATQVTRANISKASVNLTGVSAYGKVYDTTTNARINSSGNATVALGNSTLANGSTNSSIAFSNYTVTGAFTNASAGVGQSVNLSTVLTDSTNYTMVSGSQINTTATITKANVILNTSGIANNKYYDGTTAAAISTNSSGVVQLGNSSSANGSLAAESAFGPASVTTTGVFASPNVGLQAVNLINGLIDSTNFTIVSGSALFTSAYILANQGPGQNTGGAIFSTPYILQNLAPTNAPQVYLTYSPDLFVGCIESIFGYTNLGLAIDDQLCKAYIFLSSTDPGEEENLVSMQLDDLLKID